MSTASSASIALTPPDSQASPPAGNSSATINRVVNYYDKTLTEYRLVLELDKHIGIHYGYYDSEHRTYPQASQNMNRVLAEKVGMRAGARVLDAGCGIGGSSIWLARNCGAQPTGITITASQCERARSGVLLLVCLLLFLVLAFSGYR